MSVFEDRAKAKAQIKEFIEQLAQRVASGEYDVLSCQVNPDPEDRTANIALKINVNSAPVSFDKATQEIGPSEFRFPGVAAPLDDTRWPDGVPKTREMIAYERAVKEGRAGPMSPEVVAEMKQRSEREAERDKRRRMRRGSFLTGDWDERPDIDPKFVDPKLMADPTSKVKPASQYEPSRIRPGTMVRDLIFDDEPDMSEPTP